MTRVVGFEDSWIANLVGFKQHAGTYSGIATSDIGMNASGQMRVAAFNGSGILEYRQGPYESWAIKIGNINTGGPLDDGFHPLVPSGLITSLPTLQKTYENSRASISVASILIQAPFGNLNLVANDRKTAFLPWGGTRAPVNISGVSSYNTGSKQSQDLGDITMFNHANVVPTAGGGGGPVDAGTTTAQSLGPGHLALNTGSGIINLMIGSGIAQFNSDLAYNVGVNAFTWTRIPIPTVFIGDTSMSADNNLSGVRVWVPGLYDVRYVLGVDKTAGTTGRTMASRLVKFEANQIGSAINIIDSNAIDGSYAYGVIQNTTTIVKATLAGHSLVNVRTAGALIGIETTFAPTGGAGQNVSSIPSGTSMILQRIGPTRSGF